MAREPNPLDYASPAGPDRTPAVEWAVLGTITGVAIGVVSLGAAFISANDDRGHAVVAKLLFPYSMLGTLTPGNHMVLVIGVALVQFPAYGAACGIAAARRRFRKLPLALAIAHLLAFNLCLVLSSP